MKISFYRNMEFLNKRHTYDMKDGQEKATYYVIILNQLDNLIKWMTEFIDMLKNNSNNVILFPRYNRGDIDVNIIKIIKNEVNLKFEEQKKRLDEMKEHYETVMEREVIKKVNKSNSTLPILEERIKIQEDRIREKDFLIFFIEQEINFLVWHKRKVSYFILKEFKFKDNVLNNKINNWFFPKIEMPSYSKELYFEDNGALKYVQSIYSKISNLQEDEKNHVIEQFFKNNNFHEMSKYDITHLSELLNVYFNEVTENNITIKRCKNCGKYFLAHNKQLYCDNPSPQNIDISCRKLSDDLKEKEDKIYEIYRKTYKTQHNKLNRYIDTGNIPEEKIRERFKKWNEIARLKKSESKTADEYNKWYQTSLNWIEDFK